MHSAFHHLQANRARRRDVLLGAALAFSAPFPSAAATSRWLHSAASGPPVAADLSGLFTPARAQGERYTCAYFAATAAIEAMLARDTGQRLALSDEFLAQVAVIGRQAPVDENTSAGDALTAAQRHGMVPASARPYNPVAGPGTAGAPVPEPAAALLAQGQRLRVGDFRFPSQPNVETLMRLLGVNRLPTIITLKLPVQHSGWHDDGLVAPTPAMLRLPTAELAAIPNHIVPLTGYDRARQLFFFKNSWGAEWGDNGYGRISFADMQAGWWLRDAVFIRNLITA